MVMVILIFFQCAEARKLTVSNLQQSFYFVCNRGVFSPPPICDLMNPILEKIRVSCYAVECTNARERNKT